MEEWDEFLKGRYREGKSEEQFRQYDAEANPDVANFYKLNHEHQTYDYVLGKEKQYFGLDKGEKSIWDAAAFLNTLVDDSDPDTDLTQIEHCSRPRRLFGLTAIHVGLCWQDSFTISAKCCASMASRNGAVVGDTFPVGCAFSEHIVFPEYFANTPICTIRFTRQSMASMSRTAGSTRFICPSAMMATSTRR